MLIELDVRHITKNFGGVQALQDISFSVHGNEMIGLIGPNGAGKTTLTNILTGILKPTAGELWFNGQRIDGLPPYKIAQHGIGRTFQVTRAFRRMTVLENMFVPVMALHPTAHQRDFQQKALDILSLLTIDHLAGEYARSLSGGQQKLLELGRLLMLDPKMIILDEPFAGVHPKLAETIHEYIRTVRAQGKAFIIISHNMDTIFQLSERMLVLNFGKLIADDSPEAIRHNPAVIEAYLGKETSSDAPAVNGSQLGREEE